jgi:hypothetical protein
MRPAAGSIRKLLQPFTGLMMISSEPLRNALAPLGWIVFRCDRCNA